MKFTLNVNLAIQAIGVTIQTLTVATNLMPQGNAKEAIVLSVAVLQSISALIAHFKNPDGNSATMAYHK
mgnify:CR=1 FL=1